MIQTDTLKAVGISEQDIRQLTTAWDAFQTAKNQVRHQAPHIVCTGIYNAGKSTLLNALAGKEIFPTGDIPTTKKMAQAEFGGAVYIDTPGLNAMEEDDREAQAAYEAADFILFVANAQDGGISASEAAWLQKLKERYGSLQQRLIFVLTHSAQVDAEQLPMIKEKVCGDLTNAIGFEPKQTLCVDSVMYQDGKVQNEPLLTKNSGIPQLQVCLAEHITGATEILREVQENERAARQCDVIMQIKHCSDICCQMIQRLSKQEQFANVKDLFLNAEEAIKKATSDSAAVYDWMRYCSGNERFEGKDKSSLNSSARNYVRNFVSETLDAAKDAGQKIYERAQADYGNTGLDSAYFKKCNVVNRILDELRVSLGRHGVQINACREIQIIPDISRIDSTLLRFSDDSSYWSVDEYFNIFENRISVDKWDDYYEERGLFGSVRRLPKYVIETYNATSEIYQKIKQTFEEKIYHTRQQVDDYYWKPFQKELCAEALKYVGEMRKIAETSALDAKQATEQPYVTALDYLNTLKKEVTP